VRVPTVTSSPTLVGSNYACASGVDYIKGIGLVSRMDDLLSECEVDQLKALAKLFEFPIRQD
jgi:hypothetical protein